MNIEKAVHVLNQVAIGMQRPQKEITKAIIIVLDVVNKAQWIPVSERFPEERGRYLCYIVDNVENGKNIMTCEWYPDIKNYWFPDDEFAVGDVKAWMELPKPYEEEVEIG